MPLLCAGSVQEEALTRAQLVREKAALAIRIGVHPYHWPMLLLTSVVEQPNTRSSAKLEKDLHSQKKVFAAGDLLRIAGRWSRGEPDCKDKRGAYKAQCASDAAEVHGRNFLLCAEKAHAF